MSHVDDLVANYQRFVRLPWQANVAPQQRVWMAIYPPEQERRVRLHVPEFATKTREADHGWALIDITGRFERWMTAHEYRDAYFANPTLLTSALPTFLDVLAAGVRSELEQADDDTVVGLLGVGTLFGLGQAVRTSTLLDRTCESIRGRLLVFFPGHIEGSNYRLLDAQDGPNYHATAITADRGYL